MKIKAHSLSFAALLLPAMAFAATDEVTFNTALTNNTEWTYSDKILISQDGQEHIYFKSLNSSISSPEFAFNVTSVTVRLYCSNTAPTRYLYLRSNGAVRQSTAVTNENKTEEQTFCFNASEAVRSLTLSLEGSDNTGNWHVFSAKIFGAPIVKAPSSLRALDATGTRFTLEWDNTDTAASNEITVSRVINTPTSMSVLDDFEFEAFTNNSTNAQNILDENQQMLNYPAFSGINIFRAGSSIGVVQISTGKEQGILIHKTENLFPEQVDELEGVTLLISAAKYHGDTSGTWGLSIATCNAEHTTTNDLCTLDIGFDFPSNPVAIPLPTMHNGDLILMSPSDSTQSNRRILIDRLALVRDYVPATSTTNVVSIVSAAESPKTIRGLEPNSHYVVYVTAFDGEGNESAPSEPIEVWTSDKSLPFTISIK